MTRLRMVMVNAYTGAERHNARMQERGYVYAMVPVPPRRKRARYALVAARDLIRETIAVKVAPWCIAGEELCYVTLPPVEPLPQYTMTHDEYMAHTPTRTSGDAAPRGNAANASSSTRIEHACDSTVDAAPAGNDDARRDHGPRDGAGNR